MELVAAWKGCRERGRKRTLRRRRKQIQKCGHCCGLERAEERGEKVGEGHERRRRVICHGWRSGHGGRRWDPQKEEARAGQERGGRESAVELRSGQQKGRRQKHGNENGHGNGSENEMMKRK